MKFSLKGLLTVATAASALVLAGCGDKEVDVNKVKVGVIAGAEAQVAEVAA
ncbi:methionine ABC transporter membrane-anchored lipoprotein MetQ, partial [Escherichia coli]|nr:methionine ABC transporter membrane-anchored lipoprotein MetQ [Escherichia coli]